MEFDRTERRVIGCLVEKQFSTPDAYPLSLNALVSACNQKSNRNPVMTLHEFEITGTLLSLRQKGLVLIREMDGGRVERYGERFAEKEGLSPRETVVLAELMLRGAQTPTELARRAKRMVPVDGPGGVEEILRGLMDRGLVRLLPRLSGQRHARWMHRLAPEEEETSREATEQDAPDTPAPPPAPVPSIVTPSPESHVPVTPQAAPEALLSEEIDELRREVAELRDRVERLERGRDEAFTGL